MVLGEFSCRHGYEPSGNVPSVVVVYPAVYIACHHVLWIVLGVVTEPFWALTIMVNTVSCSFVAFWLVDSYYRTCFVEPAEDRLKRHSFQAIAMSILFWVVFALFNFMIMLVGEGLLNHSVLANIVQSTLTVILAAWYKHTKVDSSVPTDSTTWQFRWWNHFRSWVFMRTATPECNS